MRIRLLLAATVLAALGVSAAIGAPARTSASTATPTVFLLTGGGWGHGVGMGQWGAYGQAKAGRTYEEILSTYYTGVELAPLPATTPKTVRVLVGDAQKSVTVTSTKPFRVRDGSASTYPLGGTSLTLTPALELPVGTTGAREALVGPLLLLPAKGATLSFAGRQYRSNLRVAVVEKKLQVVNVIPLESYLEGVVPGEMPAAWPLEALKAQAVAARTYAVAGLVKGRSYDLYSDWRSQVYYGVTAEATAPSQAVRETRGQILTYAGKPITAFYSSSSGGRTRSALDVFGTDVPYLQSVDDAWDEASPHHTWAPRTFTAAQLGKALGVGEPVGDARLVPGAPGAPARLVLTTAKGRIVEVRITEVRSRLSLKSSSFRLGSLRLARPPGARTTTAVALSGVARDVERPVLQKLTAAGTWTAGAKLKLAEDGSFTVTVRPVGALTVRLSATGLVTAPLTIPAVGGSPS
jgi:SpoIID/LytB domain protein